MTDQKLVQPNPQIAFVLDERLSREKAGILTRYVQAMRKFARVDLINGSTTEEELIAKLGAGNYNLVLAPWYRYLAWSRVEAFYGLTRTSGPTFAGYFSDTILPYELGEQADHYRAILVDFGSVQPQEAANMVRAIAVENRRAGLRALLEPGTSIYAESWYTGQGLGYRMDNILSLPEIGRTEWVKRASAMRIVLSSLWSLVYEEGPGKTEFSQTVGSSTPRAYFQVGADQSSVIMRLCYNMPNWSPKDALRKFWPDSKAPCSAAQLLLRFADFLRVHIVTETNDVEVVAGFTQSCASEKTPTSIHTLWLEPIAPHLVTEVPFETPSPALPHLKPMPTISGADFRPRAAASSSSSQSYGLEDQVGANAKDRFVFEAATKIRDLKKMLAEKDEAIREMKRGGIGTAKPLPPPDAEALLEAFQEKYFEMRYQIRHFEIQIAELEARGATPFEVDTLRRKMDALAQREQAWIRKLAGTVEAFREAQRNPPNGTKKKA